MLKRKGRVNFFTTVALQEELLKCSLTFQKFRILGIGTFKRASIHNDSFPVPRFSVIQVCLIVKLAYVAEPQLFKRSGRSNHYRAIKISWGRLYRKIILQSYFSLPTRLLYGHLCYGKFSGAWSRRILHKFSIK